MSRNGSDGYSDYVSGSNIDSSSSSGTNQTIGIAYDTFFRMGIL